MRREPPSYGWVDPFPTSGGKRQQFLETVISKGPAVVGEREGRSLSYVQWQ